MTIGHGQIPSGSELPAGSCWHRARLRILWCRGLALPSRSAFWSIGSIAAVAVIALALAVPAAPAGAAPASPAPHIGDTFGRAVEIKPPPSLDFNNTPDDGLGAVSCPAAGSRLAGGNYFDANGLPGDLLAMVVS